MENNVKDRGPYIATWIVEIALVVFWIVVVIGMGRSTINWIGPVGLWAVGIIIILVLLGLAGREISGQWFGILIDSRNKVSLSRLQITLWTTMVLSAYLAIAIPRINAMIGDKATLTQENALNIQFPNELLLAMGISATSFAGSNLIKSNKKNKTVQIDLNSNSETAEDRRDQAKREFDEAKETLEEYAQIELNRKNEYEAATVDVKNSLEEEAKKQALEKQSRAKTLYDSAMQDKANAATERTKKEKELNAAEAELKAIKDAEGLLHRNSDPKDAKWSDLFRGEEIKNYPLVDMAKVQMFFFTVVVIVAYASAIAGILGDVSVLKTATSFNFPDFEPSLNALLGISHGTYLSVKTVDHT